MTISPETQSQQVSEYVAQITSAAEMMTALRNNAYGDNGFFDENGIMKKGMIIRKFLIL